MSKRIVTLSKKSWYNESDDFRKYGGKTSKVRPGMYAVIIHKNNKFEGL